ncbi:DoxX-like family protein [Gemmata sp. G18]|uniref:DoxX-like family protein n=1 Tax=Gemmata palustris TaxID=2822762 RepID=A0ABS5C1Y6_9BACT|nr:DoxX-like family protein [Gemmata palustris]MBP3959994.1 DoxX-like family protein [Gemmata palustris]
MSIFVEARIRGSLDELWRLTQTPDLHARWDLRFTDIEYLPRPDPEQPQQFRYATRIGFGVAVQGCGETVGEKDGANGERTSALKFWSDDPKSLIREGAGYWRYVPTDDGVRFFTAYDYRVRFGMVGRAFDRVIFRPLIGWATAWSFDRLRLWIEKGIDPAVSLQRSLTHGVAHSAVAFVWVYQGVVPKLLGPHADELMLIQQAGVPGANAAMCARLLGCGEVAFGMVMLFAFHRRWPLLLTVVLMIVATIGVAVNSAPFLWAAFNPVSLNLTVVALACIGLLAGRDLPSARRCSRKKPTGGA